MNYTTILINTLIHIILVLIFEGVFLFAILYKVLAGKVLHLTRMLDYNILNSIWNYTDWTKCCNYNWNPPNCVNPNPKELNPYYITPETYKLLQIAQIPEQQHIDSHKKYPYVVYAIIMSVLVLSVIILIFLSRYMDIYVNYKFIIINSSIIFLLICAIAGMILWFDIFNQDYQVNIAKPFLETFLEKYKSL